MAIYSVEVLRVSATGELSVAHLEIEDADGLLSSGEIGTAFSVDGVSLGADAPALAVGTLAYVPIGATVPTMVSAVEFTDGTDSFLLPLLGADVNRVGSLVGFTPTGPVQDVLAQSLGVNPQGFVFTGEALMVRTDPLSGFVDVGAAPLTIWDDDEYLEYSNFSDAPAETGAEAQGMAGDERVALDFGVGLPGTGADNFVRVRVKVATTAGDMTFAAVRFATDHAGFENVFYLPKSGQIDLSTVTGFIGERAIPSPVTGINYYEFADLDIEPVTLAATAGDDEVAGSWIAETVLADAGKDTVFGAAGEDTIDGSAGKDTIFGGRDSDSLAGGDTKDFLYGGADGDTLRGGDGGDKLFGGHGDDMIFADGGADDLRGEDGEDVLSGGDGADTLKGGGGADKLLGDDGDDTIEGGAGDDGLIDGKGADTIEGGAGADAFVFVDDSDEDTILDFEDGVDIIHLGATFDDLVFTDLAPGRVRIGWATESLIVEDGGLGLLTAADLSQADFHYVP